MFTELHGEEKREEGDRELASNHFLMCAPQSGLLRDVHGVIQRRKEGGSARVQPRLDPGIPSGGQHWRLKG